MTNLIKRLFKGNKGCCDIKIEEVKTEGVPDKNETKKVSSCCKSGTVKRD